MYITDVMLVLFYVQGEHPVVILSIFAIRIVEFFAMTHLIYVEQ